MNRLTHFNHGARRTVHGFTLLETLVALVVLSVGMLGLALLYVQTLGATRASQFRGQAVNLVADMADRIRSNRRAQGAYAGEPSNNGCRANGSTVCSPEEMAADDLHLWDQQVTAALPNGDWQIDYNGATVPPTFSLSVSWNEVGAGEVAVNVDIQVPSS